MSRSVLLVVIILSLLVGLCALPLKSSPAAAASSQPELFTNPDQPQPPTPLKHAVLRARQVVLNRAALAQLQADGTPLLLNLFENTQVSAIFTARQEFITGGYTLAGGLAGIPGSEVILAVNEEAVMVSVNTGSALYRVTSGAHSLALVEQLSPALPAPEQEPLPPPLNSGALALPSPALGSPGGDDDGKRLDVLVVYTTAATDAAGGVANINNLINIAISETNQGYANSQVTQRVNLAGTMQVNWDEAGFNWNAALNAITYGTAPFESVGTMRDAVRADLVTLVVRDAAYSYCGLGWLMTSVSTSFHAYAFTLVRYTCAVGYYSFAHEQGHNEGAHHDRWSVTDGGGGQGAYPYSFGFWMRPNPSSLFTHRTIMAYDCFKNQGVSCTRVNYWSNPGVSFSGMPTGSSTAGSEADNHLTLNNTAATVAKFRDGLPPNAPSGLVYTDLSTTSFRLNWVDNSSDESGFKIYRASQGGTDWTVLTTTGINGNTFENTGLPAGINYKYKVSAISGNGESGTSNTITAMHILAPTSFMAAPNSMIRVNLQWTDTSEGESGFKIERSPSGANTWVQIGTTGANITVYSDATLVCSTPYDYRVRTYNAVRDSPYSGIATATTSACAAPPAPVVTACVTSARGVTVKWNNVDGETSFEVQVKLNLSPTWLPAGTPAQDVLSQTIGGLAKSTAYNAQVSARNSYGNSSYTPCSFTTKANELFTPIILK